MSSTCSTEFRPWTTPLWSPYPLCWQSLRSLLLSFPLCAPLQLIRSLLCALSEELAPCRSSDRILKVLERAGLIVRGREAQWRPCRLKAGPLKDVADWVEQYRRYWTESFDRLDDYLRDVENREKKHGYGKHGDKRKRA